jgi:hypothetical protein
MSGQSNYPTSLDDDVSLYDVTDGVTSVAAAHHNNLKEAVKAVETRLGIRGTGVPTSIDYRLGNPTGGHIHNGASGQGPLIVPSTAIFMQMQLPGSIPSGNNRAMPISMGRTLILESYTSVVRVPPSGATTGFDVKFGPTLVMGASVGLAPAFPPGATYFSQPSPNLITYPSGAVITADFSKVGSNNPGQDLTINFVFRENP